MGVLVFTPLLATAAVLASLVAVSESRLPFPMPSWAVLRFQYAVAAP